jgi:uncharacterized protein YdhG (YjbR/CyaY superfamily)
MKMKMAKYTDIDSYISCFPAETQLILNKVRDTIKKVAPEAKETICYGIPTFTLNGNLVHFGGYEKHIGFYPGAEGIASFKEELSAYKGGKGSVQFPLDSKIPYTLITKIVKFRVLQNLEKAKEKSSKTKKGSTSH